MRFPAHQPAYTSVYFILQKTLYALFIKRTRVYTCFCRDKLAYRSVNENFAKQIRSINLPRFLHYLQQTLRQIFTISSSADHLRDSSSSNLEILNHPQIHGCIIDSDLSVKNRVHPCRYFLEIFIHQQPLLMHTLHYDLLLLK